MPKKLNLLGQKFGRLTVISQAPNRGKLTQWKCICSCGSIVFVDTQSLRKGHTKSCGCLRYDFPKSFNTIHGQSSSPIYRIWSGMRKRCNNKNCHQYKDYGGRGVSVCKEWSNNFKAFYDWAIHNGYKQGLTIDRIDVNGNYCPSNCRWVNMKAQNRNKRNTIRVNGESLSVICERLNLNYYTIHSRIAKLGWSIEKALNTPIRHLKR